MNKLILPLLCLWMIGCGTALKTQDSGTIDFSRHDGKTELAPVLLQYKFAIPAEEHELFFWDQDKNRFNVKIPSSTDTTCGYVIYLPADRMYALSGFLIVKTTGRIEYPLGTELNMFKLKPGVLNALPFFVVAALDADRFGIKQSQNDFTKPKQSFTNISAIREIPVKLLGVER